MVRRTRTKRGGGDWYNPMTWTQTSTSEYGPKKSWSDYTTDFTKSVSNGFNSVFSTTPSTSTYTTPSSSSSYPIPSATSTPSSSYPTPTATTMPSTTTTSTSSYTSPYQAPPNDVRYQQMTGTSSSSTTGGKKRKRKTLKKKRGGGTQDLNYATPVSGIKTAEPTYWIKYNPTGGKTKRKRN